METKAKSSDSKMESSRFYDIQKQIREVPNEFISTINDLSMWEAEIKEKEKRLKEISGEESEISPPKRTEKYKQEQLIMAKSKSATEIKATVKSNAKEEIVMSLRQQADELKNKGNNYVKLGQFEEASRCYTEAINICGDDNIYYANRALCHLRLERYEECIADCNQAIKLNPNYSKAFYRRMQAFEGLGNIKRAFDDCKQVLSMEPMNREATSSFERINKKLKLYDNVLSPDFTELSEDLIRITPINKPAYLRSKVSLNRISIKEVVEKPPSKTSFEKTNKNVENITIASNTPPNQQISKEPLKTENHSKSNNDQLNISKIKPSEEKSQMPEPTSPLKEDLNKKTLKNFSAPKTSSDFHVLWRELSKEEKYLYLKTIEPSRIKKILGVGLNSEILSDIISILSEYYMKNEINVGKFLSNISSHDQIPILSYFLNEDDKKRLTTLLDYMKTQNDGATYIEQVKSKFLL